MTGTQYKNVAQWTTSVAYGGGKVDTINGNWGNKVAEQTFPTSDRVISFYARPHYERVAD